MKMSCQSDMIYIDTYYYIIMAKKMLNEVMNNKQFRNKKKLKKIALQQSSDVLIGWA
jgi:hypothetical protein